MHKQLRRITVAVIALGSSVGIIPMTSASASTKVEMDAAGFVAKFCKGDDTIVVLDRDTEVAGGSATFVDDCNVYIASGHRVRFEQVKLYGQPDPVSGVLPDFYVTGGAHTTVELTHSLLTNVKDMDLDPGVEDLIGAQGSLTNFPGGDGGTTIVDHSTVHQTPDPETPGTNGFNFIDISPSFGHKGGRAFVLNSTLLTAGRAVLIIPSGNGDPTDPFFGFGGAQIIERRDGVAVVRNSHLRGTTLCSPNALCGDGPTSGSFDVFVTGGIGGRVTAIGNVLDGPSGAFIHVGADGKCVARKNTPATQNHCS